LALLASSVLFCSLLFETLLFERLRQRERDASLSRGSANAFTKCPEGKAVFYR
jgi:hypothetical protein